MNKNLCLTCKLNDSCIIVNFFGRTLTPLKRKLKRQLTMGRKIQLKLLHVPQLYLQNLILKNLVHHYIKRLETKKKYLISLVANSFFITKGKRKFLSYTPVKCRNQQERVKSCVEGNLLNHMCCQLAIGGKNEQLIESGALTIKRTLEVRFVIYIGVRGKSWHSLFLRTGGSVAVKFMSYLLFNWLVECFQRCCCCAWNVDWMSTRM